MAITQRDIAREAGVSQAVVSDVLQGRTRLRVSPATRERVMTAAQRLDYRPNALAQGLRARRAGQIAYLYPRDRPSGAEPILAGAMTVLAGAGLRLLLSTEVSEAALAEAAESLLRSGACDGVIVRAYGDPAELWRRLRPCRDRVVVIGQCSAPELNSVAHDVPGMLCAVNSALESRCRGRPVLISRPTQSSYERGIRDTWSRLVRAGVESIELAQVRTGGRAVAERRLAGPPGADAFVTTSEQVALGVTDVLRARGLRIGEDVDLLVMGPSSAGWVFDPGTLLLGTDGASIGEQAAALILSLLSSDRDTEPARIRLTPEILQS